MERRNFIQNLGLSSIGLAFGKKNIAFEWAQFDKLADRLSGASNEGDFWHLVRKEYTVSPNIINLNNGGVSPQPKCVQDAHIRYYQYANEAPSYYMWQILDKGREALRENLAELAGCSAEEIAINRNATEGLNSVIFGLNLKEGDEIVVCNYDYPNMKNAWRQREKRDRIKLKWVDIPVPCEDKSKLIKAFTDAFNEKTKLVHITHVVNWSGQILPVAEIAAKARERGIEVLVDGAHSFGLLDFKIEDLNCDYFATSLHKWLGAPFGSGLLYIRKEKINNIWALLSSDEPDGDDIRKFESLGTRSFASEMAIGVALDFHHLIGNQRKEDRLRYLKDFWMNAVSNEKDIQLFTPTHSEFSCCIGVFGKKGKKATDINEYLFKQQKIHAVAIEYEKVNGVRITPNVYTSENDLLKLIKAIKNMH